MNVNELENHLFDNMIPKKFKLGRKLVKEHLVKCFNAPTIIKPISFMQ